MTLPVDIDPRILEERPGDQVFGLIKHYLPFLKNRSETFAKKIVALILSDLIHDLALSKALDEVGLVLEYHAQNEGIERPTFDGSALMRDARKLSKVRSLTVYANLLGLEQDKIDYIVKAEIDRLYSDGGAKAPPKTPHQVMKIPDNFFDALADTTRAINDQQRQLKRDRPGQSPGTGTRNGSKRAPAVPRQPKDRD